MDMRLTLLALGLAGATLVAPLAVAAPPVSEDGIRTLPVAGNPSPLVEAAREGDIDAIRALVRSGADVNAAEGDGMTALHWAAHRNHAEAVEVLLYAGARLELRTRLGGYTPLLVAAAAGADEALALLLEAGGDVAARTTPGGSSALHFAAASGNARAVEILLRHGAAVDARDAHWGHTPLMTAAAVGRVDAVRALLAGGADVTLRNFVVDMPERQAEDARDRQLRNRRLAFEQEMARERAGVQPATDEAPDGARYDEERGIWVTDGDEEEAEGAGAEEGEQAEDEGAAGAEEDAADEEPAEEEEVVLDPHTPEVDPELSAIPEPELPPPSEEEEFAPLSYADLVGGYGGLTALHLAAREGHREVARELLAAGAELNALTGGDGTSVLLMATLNGHWDLAMELLDAGADPNLASDAGAAPLYAVLNLQWAPRALHPQPRAYLFQEIEYLDAMRRLLEAGADPDVRLERHLWYKSYNFDLLGVDTWGATPFWRAAYATDVRAMRLLLEYGADPHVATRRPAERSRGRGEDDASGLPPVPAGAPSVTALHAAAGVGYGEGFAANAHRHVPGGWIPAVRFLVEELGFDVNARDHNGFTPLHHAAARGDVEMIRYLVEKGADVMAVSRSGLTTADMANGPAQRVPPYPAAIALLRQMGSDFNNRCLSC